MDRPQKRLGEILVEKNLITQEQLDNVLKEQQKTKEFLGAILLRNQLVEEKDFLHVLSEQFNIPCVDIAYRYIDWDFVLRFSSSLILDHKCFPLSADDYSVTVAITNPLDAWVLKRAEEETRGFKLKVVLVSQEDMDDVISRYKKHIRKKYL